MRFNQNILNLTTQLDYSFAQIKKKYEDFSKQLEKIQIPLSKISQCLSKQDYQYMKENLQVINWIQLLQLIYKYD
ncbi:unnamed protein product [Paramecium pentaurelia]|uniref:Uncharacterized protein n=1 Tax=Paramecium pentaurelia TaxID=43138 RepID=A0A8S1YD36_9CILI|nr:unnamed protein product [Paramecium pentaurelia]